MSAKPKLKVFRLSGFDGGKQMQMVVAAPSRTAAAALFQTTPGNMKSYGSETGNVLQIAAAMSKPGTVFWRPFDAPKETPYIAKP